MSTIVVYVNVNESQLTWIDERGYPDGSLGNGCIFERSADRPKYRSSRVFLRYRVYSQVYNRNREGGSSDHHCFGRWTVGTLTVAPFRRCILSRFPQIYRAFIVWSGNWFVVIVPIMMYISSVGKSSMVLKTLERALTFGFWNPVLDIISIAAAIHPKGSIWIAQSIRFKLPYFAISMCLNILVTILIVVRLWAARKRIRKLLGSSHGKTYTGIAAMLVESAAPFAVFSFVLIVLYGMDNTVATVFVSVYVHIQVGFRTIDECCSLVSDFVA